MGISAFNNSGALQPTEEQRMAIYVAMLWPWESNGEGTLEDFWELARRDDGVRSKLTKGKVTWRCFGYWKPV